MITIDRDAVGYGWFVDPTPLVDEEFALMADGELHLLNRDTDPTAADELFADINMDLLTVVEHELGHLLGMEDRPRTFNRNSIMSQTLAVGIRRLPPAELT